MEIEEHIRRYIRNSLIGAITKVTRLGRDLKKDGVVYGVGCGVFPMSLVKVFEDRGELEFTDILNDDTKRGGDPLGFGMYSTSHGKKEVESKRFEKDSEDVGGTVAIIYVIPVEFFEPGEETRPDLQRYRVGYYGVEGGKLIGSETHLVYHVVPLTAEDSLMELPVYREYLEQYKNSYANPVSTDEEIAKEFREKVWITLKPKVREILTSFSWTDNDLTESPYRKSKEA